MVVGQDTPILDDGDDEQGDDNTVEEVLPHDNAISAVGDTQGVLGIVAAVAALEQESR